MQDAKENPKKNETENSKKNEKEKPKKSEKENSKKKEKEKPKKIEKKVDKSTKGKKLKDTKEVYIVVYIVTFLMHSLFYYYMQTLLKTIMHDPAKIFSSNICLLTQLIKSSVLISGGSNNNGIQKCFFSQENIDDFIICVGEVPSRNKVNRTEMEGSSDLCHDVS